MNTRSKILVALISCAIAGTAIISAQAHKGAKGVVKERMELMGSIASNLKTIAMMIQKKTPFNAGSAARAANTIAAHAQAFPHKFPQGSNDHPSEAKPDVWSNQEEFARQSAQMYKFARDLASVTKNDSSPAALIPQFKQLAGTCGACHKLFRQRKR